MNIFLVIKSNSDGIQNIVDENFSIAHIFFRCVVDKSAFFCLWSIIFDNVYSHPYLNIVFKPLKS